MFTEIQFQFSHVMAKCRICLCSRPRKDFSDINIVDNGETRSYKDVLNFCLAIQISDDTNTNTRLCVKCYRKIIEFYEFKALALRNNEITHNLFTNTLKENGISLPKEAKSEVDNSKLDEPLVFCSDENNIFTSDIKFELKLENESDDEVLSDVKHLKENQALIDNDEITSTNTSEKIKIEPDPPAKKLLVGKKKKSRCKKIAGVCEQCGKHVKDIHTHRRKHIPLEKQERLKCDYCEITFKDNGGKRKHIQHKHLNIRQECKVCGKSVYDLYSHMKVHNKDSFKFECIHCKKRFLTQNRLNTHLRVHTKDRPFECDHEECGACFRTKVQMKNHKRRVHDKEKSHQCDYCASSFFRKERLEEHILSHTKEKPYKCPDCGKHLQTTAILRVHRLRHTNIKNVKCTLCDATFYTKRDSYNHMLSHLKEKRYPCRYCEAKFHRSDHRKRHEHTAHLKNSLTDTQK